MREKNRRLAMTSNRECPRLNEKPKSMQEWLEKEIWPHVPETERGRHLTKEEVEDILGFGPEGV
ncbi:MAG TPA: hypothetical protein VF255_00555 [Solirubrobacterales bacterium]